MYIFKAKYSDKNNPCIGDGLFFKTMLLLISQGVLNGCKIIDGRPLV